MSANDRRYAAQRAEAKGEADFAKGVKREACPYKVTNWGVGGAWQRGWDHANAISEAAQGRCTHSAGTRTPSTARADSSYTCNYCGHITIFKIKPL